MNRRKFIISLTVSGALLATTKIHAQTSREKINALPEAARGIANEFPDALSIYKALKNKNIPEARNPWGYINTMEAPERISEQIRLDYQQGKCKTVCGWLISRTEIACIMASTPA